MSRSHLLCDLFAEDRAHEAFARAIIRRREIECRITIDLRSVVARGGHGRVLDELKLYQGRRSRSRDPGDIAMILIDANAEGWHRRRKAIDERLTPDLRSRAVIGCPDPYIERWFLADPQSLGERLGVRLKPGTKKAKRKDRNYYKTLLDRSLREAGHTVLLGGIEFADEIVDVMDTYAVSQRDPSFKGFWDDLNSSIRRITD